MSKEKVASHMVNLAWNGLRAREPAPVLRAPAQEAAR